MVKYVVKDDTFVQLLTTKYRFKWGEICNSCNINPLKPELNSSVQRCLTRFLLRIFFEPCISLIYAWKTNKCNNYLFSLLITYGSSYMFRHYIVILRERS
jgi:hypothetical protein